MSNGARRIGILGGTFDPIHWGHLDIADVAVSELKLSRLFVITSNVPPHTAAAARFGLSPVRDGVARRAGSPRTGARPISNFVTTAPSFTSRTLDMFHERGYLSSELFFVIGADAFAEIATWRDYPGILDAVALCRRLAAGVLGQGAPAAAAATGGPHGTPADRRGRATRSVDHSARCADRRCVIDCDPAATGSTANRSRASCRRTCSNTLSTTDFTRR